MALDASQVAGNFRDFRAMAKKFTKVFYGPLMSSAQLVGLATPVTFNLVAQSIPFFQVAVGATGQGFVRPMRFSETTLDGGAGQLPAGYGYAANQLGVYLPPSLPLHLKEHFARHASLAHIRHSHRWECGPVWAWGTAEYGIQSQSVSTTVANSTIEFGVNGRTSSREFPQGGELFFPPNEQIRFDIQTYEDVFVTSNSLTGNGGIHGVDPGGNVLTDAMCTVIMDGFRYEQGTA